MSSLINRSIVIVAALFAVSLCHAQRDHSGILPSPSAGNVPYRLHVPDTADPAAAQKLVVYVKNLPVKRLGAATDADLIAAFLRQGLFVAEVDYQGKAMGANGREVHREYSFLHRSFGATGLPFANGAFLGLRWNRDLLPGIAACPVPYPRLDTPKAKEGLYRVFVIKGKSYTIDPSGIYVLPAGFTLIRDIEVARFPGGKPPRDRAFMDLILPSQPVEPVPVMLELSPCANTDHYMTEETPFPMSYTYYGYAVALLNNVFEITDGKRTDGIVFPEQKAIRMLRGRKAEWGLSGKVGMMGISKSSYRTLLTAAKTPGKKGAIDLGKSHSPLYAPFYHAAIPDFYKSDYPEELKSGVVPWKEALYAPLYQGVQEELQRGPYAKENGRPDAFMCSDMGPAVAAVLPYLDQDLPPMFYNLGNKSGRVGNRIGHVIFDLMRPVLQQSGAKEVILNKETELEHHFNYIQYDRIRDFFDQHLKSGQKPCATVVLKGEK